jgi:arsenical pump membrane protein
MVITLLGFFSEPWTGLPTAFVAAAGATILLVGYRVLESGRPATVVREIGWDAVIFVMGIFVVAHGLRAAGLTDAIGTVLYRASEVGMQLGTLATGLVAAVLSAVMNNHPTTATMALAIGDLPLEPTSIKLLAMSALIGGDLGPKMLPIGSLAALLWLRMLRTRGVEISYLQYVKLGVPVTLVAVACSLLALNLEYLLFLAFR